MPRGSRAGTPLQDERDALGRTVIVMGKDPDEAPDDDGSRWLVETPNPEYNGVTMGIRFTNGKAILWNREFAETMARDFGYTIREIPPDSLPLPVQGAG